MESAPASKRASRAATDPNGPVRPCNITTAGNRPGPSGENTNPVSNVVPSALKKLTVSGV